MNNCGNCAHYGMAPTTGPICTKTGKAISFLLAGKPCWEERTAGPQMATKVCNRCHRELPVSEFSRNHTRKDGYQCQCKDCQREISRATYVRHKDEPAPEPVKERTTKVCTKCGKELPLERFGRNPRSSDGLKCYCKDCENENCRTYRAKKYGKKEGKPKKMDIPIINELLQQPVPAISTFTDDALIAELRRRGWHGTITKETIIL